MNRNPVAAAGLASITTTTIVYGHLTDAMLGRAADRTGAILSRAARPARS